MSRIEAVHVGGRRRKEGGRSAATTACQASTPQGCPQARKRKQKQAKRGEKTSQRNAWHYSGNCRVLPPKDGLEITLKAKSADNESEKRSKRIFDRR